MVPEAAWKRADVVKMTVTLTVFFFLLGTYFLPPLWSIKK
jgi:hypothetical protein